MEVKSDFPLILYNEKYSGEIYRWIDLLYRYCCSGN